MNTLIAIAVICLIVLVLYGFVSYRAAKIKDPHDRIMDNATRHISPKP